MKLQEPGICCPWRSVVLGVISLTTLLQASSLTAQCDPPFQTGIACNDYVQISLPGNCEQEIFPDMVMEADPWPNAVYTVELFHGVNALGNIAHGGLIGLPIAVQVTNTCTGESCWGNLEVLDLWAPQFVCPEDPVLIFCGQDENLVPPPLLSDNCDAGLVPLLLGETAEEPGCGAADGVWKIISRQWGGEDASGNEASPCEQRIHVVRGTLDQVVFPSNRDGAEGPVVECDDPDTSPAATGYPTLNGQPLTGEQCSFSAYYSDILIPGCASTTKILRNWTVWDGCQGSIPGENPLHHTQIIWIADQEPPSIQCPAAVTAYLQSISCEGPVELPALEVSDNCSGYTVGVQTEAENLESNGGIAEGLLPGLHSITYTATDACGNQSVCEIALTVADGVSPVAICDENTVIALDADGVAQLPAGDPDDGSYDGCTEVSFLIRRMDAQAEFGPWAEFTCEDVGAGPVAVEMQVSDLFGNAGFCMVQVTVQDKIAPQLSCPPAITLDCWEDPTDLSLTGTPEVWDSCTFVSGWTDVGQSSNACGWGALIRTFVAADPSGNQTSCQQTITMVNDDPFDIGDITWPEDFVYTDCIAPEYFHPDSLPEASAWPVFAGHPCALAAVNYEDQYFDVAAPACFKIVRTWRVIDWCQFDAMHPDAGGYWEYQQVLKVEDHTPPAMFCSFGSFVKVLSPNCEETITLPQPGITDCSPDVEIAVESPFGEGFGPFPGVPLGSYPVTYTATDHCGNYSYCSFTLQVVDAKNPTPICKNGLVVELMQTGMVEIPAWWLNEGSFDNCTDQEDLIFSFSPNPADSILLVNCNTPAGLVIKLWVTDEFGNTDYCQLLILIEDNLDVCPPSPLAVAGLVQTETGMGVMEVLMEMNDPATPSTFTDTAGYFYISGLEEGWDYTLTAEKDLDPGNGVTTYDMVLVARHILGTQLLDSPYKIIAADVNRSNTVSTADLVDMRKLILQYEDSFPGNTSWRFIDASYFFPDPADPFQEPFPEAIHYNDFTPGLPPPSFIAVKTGDVNQNAEGN